MGGLAAFAASAGCRRSLSTVAEPGDGKGTVEEAGVPGLAVSPSSPAQSELRPPRGEPGRRAGPATVPAERSGALAEAEALVEAALRGREPPVWQEALRALELAGGAEAVRGVRRLVEAFPEIETEASVRLSRIASREAAPALLALLEARGERGPLAAAAVRALGRCRLRLHVPLLVALTRPGVEEYVRLAALAALGELADPDAIEGLAAALEDASARLRRQALRSLRSYRSVAAQKLLEGFLARAGDDASGIEVQLAREALAEMRGEPRGLFR